MKMNQTKFALGAVLATSTAAVLAQGIDINPRLELRNRTIQLDKITKKYLFDESFKRRVSQWLSHPTNATYGAACQNGLAPIFPNKRMVGALCYVLHAKPADALPLVNRWEQEIRTALFELMEDPRYGALDPAYPTLARSLYAPFQQDNNAKIGACLGPVKGLAGRAENSVVIAFQQANACFNTLPKVKASSKVGNMLMVPYLSLVLPNVFPQHPGHAVSETGWIPGNQVTYLTKSDTSPELKANLEKAHQTIMAKYAVMGADGKPTGEVNKNAFIATFISLLQKGGRAFNKADGLWEFEDHPAWKAPDGSILSELRKAYDSAEETIFMDLFFLGGSTGGALANHLFDLLEKKPNLKIFILHDSMNPFAKHIDAEMTAVFNYIQAYSVLHPDRLVAVQSHIRSHKSGLPKFTWGVLTDGVLKETGLDKSLSLYGRAMSDHSKVTVIDGKTDHPVSFVGSKNMTDASGPNCYDEVIRTSGPAATVVQDDYYRDMVAALSIENSKGTTKRWAVNGWTKGLTESMKESDLIAGILRPFDPMERDGNGNPRVKVPAVPLKGNAVLRTGFNSYDSARTNLLDENIQMILFAKKTLFLKDQYLFDRNLVRAMLQTKAALGDKIDMRVILEPLPAAGIPHMPNILYLDILKKAKIGVKWKKTLYAKDSPVEQVYHMKTISADGSYVIAGSANKDQTTMFGSFREEQMDVKDAAAAAEHDRAFNAAWNDPAQTEEVVFTMPTKYRDLNGMALSFEQFLDVVRKALAVAYDARDL